MSTCGIVDKIWICQLTGCVLVSVGYRLKIMYRFLYCRTVEVKDILGQFCEFAKKCTTTHTRNLCSFDRSPMLNWNGNNFPCNEFIPLQWVWRTVRLVESALPGRGSGAGVSTEPVHSSEGSGTEGVTATGCSCLLLQNLELRKKKKHNAQSQWQKLIYKVIV